MTRDFVENIIARIKSQVIAESVHQSKCQKDLSLAAEDRFAPKDSTESKRLPNFAEVIIRDQMNPNIPDDQVMSHDELVSEMIFMLSAGFETTKTATTIALVLLALHPNIQQNVSIPLIIKRNVTH